MLFSVSQSETAKVYSGEIIPFELHNRDCDIPALYPLQLVRIGYRMSPQLHHPCKNHKRLPSYGSGHTSSGMIILLRFDPLTLSVLFPGHYI
jgi:hypothetical protein